MSFATRPYAALAAAILAASCSDSLPTPPPLPAVTVAVTGVIGTIYEGDVATLRATVRDASGAELPGATVTWSSNDSTIAEVAANGVTTALRNGSAHQVFIEGGTLRLTGAPQPRYVLHVAYTEYNVRTVDGRQVYEPRLQWRENDRGVVSYDARGDLAMTSELISPLAHTASAVSGGVQLDFRVPGTNEILPLFYRRESE